MPKELFFNISVEKRSRFIEAAREEFTTKQFKDVSVNTIVKKAGISRGSFYTYFENLEECFTYIIKDVRDERFKYGMKLLQEVNSDYFSLVRNLFEYDYDAYSASGKYSLFKNYIYFLQSHQFGNMKDNLIIDLIKSLKKQGINFKELFNVTALNVNEEEFLDLIEVVILLMVNTFLKSESEQLSKEETIRLFNKRIDYIEFGVKRR
jgi:AcrR family transcriptional regulator